MTVSQNNLTMTQVALGFIALFYSWEMKTGTVSSYIEYCPKLFLFTTESEGF